MPTPDIGQKKKKVSYFVPAYSKQASLRTSAQGALWEKYEIARCPSVRPSGLLSYSLENFPSNFTINQPNISVLRRENGLFLWTQCQIFGRLGVGYDSGVFRPLARGISVKLFYDDRGTDGKWQAGYRSLY